MTTTIGRCSFTNAPSFQSWDGDALSLGINILPASLELAKVMRQQMLGLMNNPDESAIPVTSTDDPDLDGFYTVTAVNVEPVQAYLTNKLMRCSVGLVRVANGYQNPTVETTVVSRLATNDQGIASTTDYGAMVAYKTSEVSNVDLTGVLSVATYAGSMNAVDGDGVDVYSANPTTNVAGYWSQFATPSTYYDPPACKIEYLVGSTWYEAVGRQVPNGVGWRISNGFLRIGTTAALPEANVTIEVADSSAYVGREITNVNGDLGGLTGPFIIRNSPEMVTIRVGTNSTHTFTVWKGGSIAQITQWTSVADTLNLRLVSAVAGTAITGGVRMTSNDANGNRLALMCRSTVTNDLTNTRIILSSAATSAVFGVGYHVSPPNGNTYFEEDGMIAQLCAPPQWRQRIAAR